MTWVSNERKDNSKMRKADEFLLAQIREGLLADFPDDQWKLVEEEVEKAGGVREVGGYIGVLLRDAIAKASFGGDRSAAGRYAAEQRWKGHEKGGARGRKAELAEKYPRAGAVVDLPSPTGPRSAEESARIKRNVEQLRIEREAKRVVDAQTAISQVKGGRDKMLADYDKMESRAREKGSSDPQDDAMADFQRKYGVSLMQVEAAGDFEQATQTVQSDKGDAPATEDDKLILSRPDLLPEEAFRDKKQFKNYRQTETYNKIVQNKKAEIVRGKDGTATHRGSNLTAAQDNLAGEEEMLRSFESGERSARKILGSPFNKTDARAILQARVADANARVQALEEFEDERSPGYFGS
jgi:hypothetical protein